MKIRYLFLEPVEYLGWDNERGEEYFSEEEYEYDFEPSEKQLREAAVYIYSDKSKTVTEQVQDLIEELIAKDDEDYAEMKLDSSKGFATIDEAIDKVFGKIEDFLWDREDDLRDYFQDEAREQFKESL